MNRILVLADEWNHFTYWCLIQEPRENPNDRKFTVITPDLKAKGGTRGFHREVGDRFIRLNSAPYGWPGRYVRDDDRPPSENAMRYLTALEEIQAILAPAGWFIEEAERIRT